MSTKQQIQIAAKMYEAHAAVKRLCREEDFPRLIAEWQKIIRTIMDGLRIDVIPAAMKVVEEITKGPRNDGIRQLWVLAAAVEMIEPGHAD